MQGAGEASGEAVGIAPSAEAAGEADDSDSSDKAGTPGAVVEERPLGGRFVGAVHHKIVGDVGATLSLVEQLGEEPAVASSCGPLLWRCVAEEDASSPEGGEQPIWWRCRQLATPTKPLLLVLC